MECDVDHTVPRETLDLERLADEVQQEHRRGAYERREERQLDARSDAEILADAALMLAEQMGEQRRRWGFV